MGRNFQSITLYKDMAPQVLELSNDEADKFIKPYSGVLVMVKIRISLNAINAFCYYGRVLKNRLEQDRNKIVRPE